jgi:hypothetical protein
MGGGMGGGMFGGMPSARWEGNGGALGADPFAPPPPKIDLAQGVEAAASGNDVGELFRYAIKSPVTLARDESAMLPIVNESVKSEKVVIYNPSVHAKHPLSGLRLTNTTPLHLMQGPITVFDGGEYAGDARIEDLAPGSTRLISYALDLDTEVTIERLPVEESVVGIRIREGMLIVKHRHTRRTNYVLKNSSEHAKEVIVERPIDMAWKTIEPVATEKTRALERFTHHAQPGKPATLVVRDEKGAVEELNLSSLMPGSIEIYRSMPTASEGVKNALQEVAERRQAIEKFGQERAALEERVTDLEQQQARVRTNLHAVPEVAGSDPFAIDNKKLAGELLKRYLEKMAELDGELERRRSELVDARQVERGFRGDLEKFLKGLSVE